MTTLICLRCAHANDEEKAYTGCSECDTSVFLRSHHPQKVEHIVRHATPAQKEALLSALDDALGEDADRACMYVVDVASIAEAEGVFSASVTVRDADGTRTVLLDEEPALAFLSYV